MKAHLHFVILTLSLFISSVHGNGVPLPEQEPPFVNVPIPAHRTFTVRYVNPSRFSFIDCSCNTPDALTATWYHNGSKITQEHMCYILLDTYGANSRGKLHLYNTTDHNVTITCQPKFEPPSTG